MSNKAIVQALIGNAGTVLNHVRGNMKTGNAIWKVEETLENGDTELRWYTIGTVADELAIISMDAIPAKKATKATKNTKVEAPTLVAETVTRIGRNYLPTRTWSDGRVERNRKVDGSGEWIAVAV